MKKTKTPLEVEALKPKSQDISHHHRLSRQVLHQTIHLLSLQNVQIHACPILRLGEAVPSPPQLLFRIRSRA